MWQLNNPAVLMTVRQNVRSLIAEGALDEASAALVLRATEKAAKRGPAGWLYALGQSLGAPAERALQAAAVAHVIYAAFDITDDVQDGDVGEYLADLSPAVQVNVAIHLWVLGGLLAQRFAAGESGLGAATFTEISRAFCGQRLDLTRTNWSTAAYEAMIRGIGGAQFVVYMLLVAEAAGLPLDTLRDFGVTLASLVQLESDHASDDSRITGLPVDEVSALRERLRGELRAALAAAPAAAMPVLERVAQFAETSASK